MAKLKRCPVCDVPEIMGRDHIWTPEGTITIPSDKTFRMVFLEYKVLNDIMTEFKKDMGDAIDNIVFESKRIYSRQYIDGLLKGPLGFLVRTGIASKKVYKEVSKTGITLGFGNVSVDHYRRKKFVEGVVKEPYYPAFFAGDVAGVFESVEQTHSKGTWEKRDDGWFLKAEASKEAGYLEDRMRHQDDLIPGKYKHELCSKCLVSKGLSDYVWEEELGTITRGKNERVFLMGSKDLNGVFNELKDALGDPITEGMFKINYKYGKTLVKRKVTLKDYVNSLPKDGWGEPIKIRIDKEKGTGQVKINNYFNADFIAPRVQALFENEVGKAEIEVKEKKGTLDIKLTKKMNTLK